MSTKYQDILYPLLRKHKIKMDYSSVRLHGPVLKMRDGEWIEYVRSFQFVKLKHPDSPKGKVQVIAKNEDDLMYVLGNLEYFEMDPKEFSNPRFISGIILDLKTKIVETKTQCYEALKDVQPILLVDCDVLPIELSDMIYESSGSMVKKNILKAPGNKSCASTVVLALTAFAFTILIWLFWFIFS